MATQNTEPKRGRGRPASFPNTKTVAFLANIPAGTRAQLREVAEKRGEPLNVTLDRMIQRGHKDAMRSRKSK